MQKTTALASVSLAILMSGATAGQDIDPESLVATRIGSDVIAATVLKAPPDAVSDQQIRHVEVPQTNVGVGIVHRPAHAAGTPFGLIRHHRQSEVYRVISGSGTLVTTTAVADETELDPTGEIVRSLTGPSSRGTAAGAYASQELGEGDIVIIPAGVAHGFSAIEGEITYLVIRIDPDRLVELK